MYGGGGLQGLVDLRRSRGIREKLTGDMEWGGEGEEVV